MNLDPETPPSFDIPQLTLRAMFFLSAAGLGLYLARIGDAPDMEFPAMLIGGFLALMVIFVDMAAVGRSSIATVSAIVFGLLIGFLAAQLFIGIVSLMGDFADETGKRQLNGIRLCVTLIFCYLGPSYLLRTKDDLRFVVPYVEFQRQVSGPQALILDTSAIIDGRIVELARAGLFEVPMVVPRYVIEELQRIADSHDKNRRVRGRRGLDKLKILQGLPSAKLEFPRASYGEKDDEVDRRLIESARARAGKLVTVDLNLQKVCELEGIPVLNLNEIARASRATYIPGDQLGIRIVKPGEGPKQGVGYLDDGTMVVVEGAREFKGKHVQAVVTSSIQSSAGRMVFAKRLDPDAKRDRSDEASTDSEAGTIASAEGTEAQPASPESSREEAQEAEAKS